MSGFFWEHENQDTYYNRQIEQDKQATLGEGISQSFRNAEGKVTPFTAVMGGLNVAAEAITKPLMGGISAAFMPGQDVERDRSQPWYKQAGDIYNQWYQIEAQRNPFYETDVNLGKLGSVPINTKWITENILLDPLNLAGAAGGKVLGMAGIKALQGLGFSDDAIRIAGKLAASGMADDVARATGKYGDEVIDALKSLRQFQAGGLEAGQAASKLASTGRTLRGIDKWTSPFVWSDEGFGALRAAGSSLPDESLNAAAKWARGSVENLFPNAAGAVKGAMRGVGTVGQLATKIATIPLALQAAPLYAVRALPEIISMFSRKGMNIDPSILRSLLPGSGDGWSEQSKPDLNKVYDIFCADPEAGVVFLEGGRLGNQPFSRADFMAEQGKYMELAKTVSSDLTDATAKADAQARMQEMEQDYGSNIASAFFSARDEPLPFIKEKDALIEGDGISIPLPSGETTKLEGFAPIGRQELPEVVYHITKSRAAVLDEGFLRGSTDKSAYEAGISVVSDLDSIMLQATAMESKENLAIFEIPSRQLYGDEGTLIARRSDTPDVYRAFGDVNLAGARELDTVTGKAIGEPLRGWSSADIGEPLAIKPGQAPEVAAPTPAMLSADWGKDRALTGKQFYDEANGRTLKLTGHEGNLYIFSMDKIDGSGTVEYRMSPEQYQSYTPVREMTEGPAPLLGNEQADMFGELNAPRVEPEAPAPVADTPIDPNRPLWAQEEQIIPETAPPTNRPEVPQQATMGMQAAEGLDARPEATAEPVTAAPETQAEPVVDTRSPVEQAQAEPEVSPRDDRLSGTWAEDMDYIRQTFSDAKSGQEVRLVGTHNGNYLFEGISSDPNKRALTRVSPSDMERFTPLGTRPEKIEFAPEQTYRDDITKDELTFQRQEGNVLVFKDDNGEIRRHNVAVAQSRMTITDPLAVDFKAIEQVASPQAKEVAAEIGAEPPAPQRSTLDAELPNKSTIHIADPRGTAPHDLDVSWQVEDLDNIVFSHDWTGKTNPEYPEELQNRDRATRSSREQMIDYGTRLDVEELVKDSRGIDDGSPVGIRGDDGKIIIIAGNGRMGAIGYAKDKGKAGWGTYVDRVKGMQDVGDIKNPVMVRVIDTDLEPQQLRDLAVVSNDPGTAELNFGERALTDASLLDVDKMQRIIGNPDMSPEAFLSSENMSAFTNDFATNIAGSGKGAIAGGEKMSPEGAARMQASFLAYAFEGDDAARSIQDIMREHELRAGLQRGIIGAAPDIASLKAIVNKTNDTGRYDIAPDVRQALDILLDAKRSGRTLDEVLNTNKLGDVQYSDEARKLAKVFAMSGNRDGHDMTYWVRKMLGTYSSKAHMVIEQDHSANGTLMLIGMEPLTKQQLLEQAMRSTLGDKGLFTEEPGPPVDHTARIVSAGGKDPMPRSIAGALIPNSVKTNRWVYDTELEKLMMIKKTTTGKDGIHVEFITTDGVKVSDTIDINSDRFLVTVSPYAQDAKKFSPAEFEKLGRGDWLYDSETEEYFQVFAKPSTNPKDPYWWMRGVTGNKKFKLNAERAATLQLAHDPVVEIAMRAEVEKTPVFDEQIAKRDEVAGAGSRQTGEVLTKLDEGAVPEAAGGGTPPPPIDTYEAWAQYKSSKDTPTKAQGSPWREKISVFKDKIMAAVFDRYAGMHEYGEDLWKAYQISRGRWQGKAASILHDFDTQVLSPMNKAGNLELFGDYMQLAHSVEVQRVYDDWLSPTANPMKALEGMRAEIGDVEFAKLTEAAGTFAQLNKDLMLKPLLDQGVISEDVFNMLTTDYKYYVPLYRDGGFEDLWRPESKAAIASAPGEFSELMGRGSKALPIKEVLGSYFEQVGSVSRFMEKNKLATMTRDALEAHPAAEGSKLIYELKGQEKAKDGFGTIVLHEDGIKKRYAIDEDVARMANELDDQGDHAFLQLMRKLSLPLRFGATTYNPNFLIRNPIRDIISAYWQEGDANLPGFMKSWFDGLRSVIKQDDAYWEAARSGGFTGGLMEDVLGKAPSQGTGRGAALQVHSAKDALLFLPHLISAGTQITEEATRMGVWKLLGDKGFTTDEMAYRMSNSTVNFDKAGYVTKVVNSIIPFTNARLQGTTNMFAGFGKNISEKGVPVTAAKMLWFLMPVALCALNNKRFETADDIPDYEYEQNYIIQVGEGQENEDPKYPGAESEKYPIYLRIPKGGAASLMTLPLERLMHMEDDSSLMQVAGQMLTGVWDGVLASSPIDTVPTVPGIGTVQQISMNRDSFRSEDIVPASEMSRPEEYQFDEGTTRPAVALGKLLGVSPRYVDFAVRDFTGGGGALSMWVSDLVMDAAGYDPTIPGQVKRQQMTPAQEASKAPFVSGIFGTRGNQSQRLQYQDMDEALSASRDILYENPEVKRFGLGVNPPSETITIDGVPQRIETADRSEIVNIETPMIQQALQQLITKDWYRRAEDADKLYFIDSVRKKIQTNVRDYVLQDMTGEQAMLWGAQDLGLLLQAVQSYQEYQSIPSYYGLTADQIKSGQEASSTVQSWRRSAPQYSSSYLWALYAQDDAEGATLGRNMSNYRSPVKSQFWSAHPELSMYYGGVSADEMQTLDPSMKWAVDSLGG